MKTRLLLLILVIWLSAIQGIAVGNHFTKLAWNPVKTFTDGQPITPDVVYTVYKSQTGVTGTFAPIVSNLPLAQTSYNDYGVKPKKTYWYYVTAYDVTVNTESVSSNVVSVVAK